MTQQCTNNAHEGTTTGRRYLLTDLSSVSIFGAFGADSVRDFDRTPWSDELAP